MTIFVCTECGKAKKSKVPSSEKRIRGKKVFSYMSKWLGKNNDLIEPVKVRAVGCLDQCKNGPAIFIREQRVYEKRLTKEKLKSFLKSLRVQPNA